METWNERLLFKEKHADNVDEASTFLHYSFQLPQNNAYDVTFLLTHLCAKCTKYTSKTTVK